MYVFTTACLKKKTLQCNLSIYAIAHRGSDSSQIDYSAQSNHRNSYKLRVWGNILINFVYVVRKNSLTQYTHKRYAIKCMFLHTIVVLI